MAKIKIGKVKGSDNQSGGQTGYNPNSNKNDDSNSFKNRLIFWTTIIGFVIAILTYLGIQPNTQEIQPLADTVFNAKPIHIENNILHEEKITNGKHTTINMVNGNSIISSNQTGGQTAHTINNNYNSESSSSILDLCYMQIEKMGNKYVFTFCSYDGTTKNINLTGTYLTSNDSITEFNHQNKYNYVGTYSLCDSTIIIPKDDFRQITVNDISNLMQQKYLIVLINGTYYHKKEKLFFNRLLCFENSTGNVYQLINEGRKQVLDVISKNQL